MNWRPTITISEISSYKNLFGLSQDTVLLKFFTRILKAVEYFLEYPITIAIPTEVRDFAKDPESLRALRILSKLRDSNFIKSFHYEEYRYPDEPPGHVSLVELAEIQRFGFSGKGADLFDKSATIWPALGEAIERYSIQFFYPQTSEFIDSSAIALKQPKVDIFNIAGFDSVKRNKKHAQFTLQYNNDSQFRWIKVTRLPDLKKVWAPLQWFSFSHVQQYLHKDRRSDGKPVEPMLSVPITTGAATGQTREDAIYRGILEIIERDAFIIYWLNQLVADKVDLDSFNEKRFRDLRKLEKRYRLETHLLYLKTDVPVHTVCSIVIDRTGCGPAVIVGAKSGLNLSDVAFGALAETFAQRTLYRRMYESNREKVKEDFVIENIDHEGRMLYWFNTDRLNDIEPFISGEVVDIANFPVYRQESEVKSNLDTLLKFFVDNRYEVFYQDLLSKKLTQLTEGLSVVMVKIPKMQPVYLEESLKSVGGDRLYEVPEKLGFKRKVPHELSTSPHPFP